MTPRALRVVRGGLLGGLVVVGVVIAGSLRQAPAPVAPPVEPPSGGSRIDGVVYRTFREGSEHFQLEAERWEGQDDERIRLEQVQMRFKYHSRGEVQPATIRSDTCTYTPAHEKAEFEGHVHLVTGDGLELDTDKLDYEGRKGIARTASAVAFSRKGVSGRSVGARYEAESGQLDLASEVELRIADPDQTTTTVTGGRASVRRDEGVLRFEDGVVVTQGDDTIEARWLTADMDSEYRIRRAQFGGGVVARSAGSAASGVVPGPPASRILEGQRLDVRLRPATGKLQRMVAGPEASLLVLPTDEPFAERRRLEARYLSFSFDEQGRLAGLRSQKQTRYESTPVDAAHPPRRLTCQRFETRLAPGTARVVSAAFHSDVVYAEGATRARADEASYDGRSGRLTLRGAPKLEDVEERSELFADDIYIETSGAVMGRDHVRHVLRGGDAALPGGTGGEPAIVTCRVFDHDPASKELLYRGGALLRHGDDEVRAESLRMSTGDGSDRRLIAEGKVVSLLGTATEAGARADPEPGTGRIEATADRMEYAAADHRITYQGDVSIRQGDIGTRSPKAVLDLDPTGRRLLRLVAGEPVSVRFGDRTAQGRQGTYTPEDRTMLLVGEDATLVEPTRELKGRSLTFRLGDDRILIDGREEVRTEMLIK